MLNPAVSRSFQLAIAFAAALAMLVQCDIYDVWLFGPLLMVLGWLGAFCCGSWLFIDALISRIRRRPAPHIWTALLLAIAVGPGAPFINTPFLWVSASHKLLRHRAEYLSAIAVADAGGKPPEIYMTEEGPSFHYFVWSGAGDDSWGIVHDRSQTFSEADPESTFGGYFVTNLHLWGPWYFLQLT